MNSYRSASPFVLALLVLLGGCASQGARGAIDAMSCPELNVAIGETAREMSSAAIREADAANYSVPFWVPGGNKAKEAIAQRQARRLEAARDRQRLLIAERSRRCA